MITYRIQELTEKKGISARELARLTGLSHSTCASLVKAKTSSEFNISLQVVDKLCAALNCKPTNILVYKND